MNSNLLYFILQAFFFFVFICIADGANQKANKSNKTLRAMFSRFSLKACKSNVDCSSFHCCPVPGLKETVKECSIHNCETLQNLAKTKIEKDCFKFGYKYEQFYSDHHYYACNTPLLSWYQTLLFCYKRNYTMVNDIIHRNEIKYIYVGLDMADMGWTAGQKIVPFPESNINTPFGYNWVPKYVRTPYLGPNSNLWNTTAEYRPDFTNNPSNKNCVMFQGYGDVDEPEEVNGSLIAAPCQRLLPPICITKVEPLDPYRIN